MAKFTVQLATLVCSIVSICDIISDIKAKTLNLSLFDVPSSS